MQHFYSTDCCFNFFRVVSIVIYKNTVDIIYFRLKPALTLTMGAGDIGLLTKEIEKVLTG